MNDEAYRLELRQHFMGQMKNAKFQSSIQNEMRCQHKLPDFREVDSLQHPHTGGGDADRALYEAANVGCQNNSDTYRTNNDACCIHHQHYNHNPHASSHKYPQNDNIPCSYETDSATAVAGEGSQGSASTKKTSKSVASKRSSQDLRKIVKSQCKLHEAINKTIKQMCNSDNEAQLDTEVKIKPENTQELCKQCIGKNTPSSGRLDKMTEIVKGDFANELAVKEPNISADEVVNSKIINPMIRKLQRMYLNSLKDEMSLMEDLEHLPHKVSEVYNTKVFKQND